MVAELLIHVGAAHRLESPRTVEWQLRKVYTKLGVGSRKGRRSALRRPDRERTAS